MIQLSALSTSFSNKMSLSSLAVKTSITRPSGCAKSSVLNCWPTVCWISSLICALSLAASKRFRSVIIQSATIGAVSGNANHPAIFPVRSAWCIFGRTTSGTRKLRSTKEPSERPIRSLLFGKIAVCGSGIPNGWRNKTVIANQSANPPIIPASAPARTN